MAGTNWQCCCESGTCLGTCSGDSSYALTGMSLYVAYENAITNNGGPGCCFNNVSYAFQATITPVGGGGVVTVTRQPLIPSIPCCYTASFDMTVTGEFSQSWDFNVIFGGGRCTDDQTHTFNETVPAQLDIYCVGGNTWCHELTICHFQVTCAADVLSSDCETACTAPPYGIRCAGGTLLYFTDIVPLDQITTRFGEQTCSVAQFGCENPPLDPGLLDYANLFTAEGACAFFALYTTDECSGGDPFLPCDPDYASTFITFESAPTCGSGEYWCDATFVDEMDIPLECRKFTRQVNWNKGVYI